MVGQKRLLDRINSYKDIPHSILLCGKVGCGKSLMTQYISHKYMLPIKDITKSITLETIIEAQICPTPYLYVINLDEANEKQQNIILKFLEEPNSTVYIALKTSSKYGVIDTVMNRCVVFDFEDYSKEELLQYIESCDTVYDNKELVIEMCETPGQISRTNTNTLISIKELCGKIVDKLSVATFTNTLSISNKINYKDDFDKYDIDIFFKCLMRTIQDRYINGGNSYILTMYKVVNEYYNKLRDTRLNKEHLMVYMLDKLWNITK